jgi:hypothetical protein
VRKKLLEKQKRYKLINEKLIKLEKSLYITVPSNSSAEEKKKPEEALKSFLF